MNVNIEKVGNLISSGPYVVSYFSKKGLVTLKNKNDKELKKKYNKAQLKLFFGDQDGINEYQHFPKDEIDQSGDDCIKNPFSDIFQNNQPLGEKPVENIQNSQIPAETPVIAINSWDKLPDEIVKKILIHAIKSSSHVCET